MHLIDKGFVIKDQQSIYHLTPYGYTALNSFG